MECDHLFEVAFVGDISVGMTSIRAKYCGIGTIMDAFSIKRLQIRGETIKLQIWDITGDERFRSFRQRLYRDNHGVFILYDITNRDSFEHCHDHWKIVEKYKRWPEVKIFLIGNKSDLSGKRCVGKEEGEILAAHYGIPFFEVSAKSGHNIDEIFTSMANSIVSLQMVKSC